jgi:hypothetical protein
VACLVNTDCTNSAEPICKEGECVQCADDTNCPPTAPKCKGKVCVVK